MRDGLLGVLLSCLVGWGILEGLTWVMLKVAGSITSGG